MFSVVVVSCDKYKELWTPFFSLWEKYWTDRAADVVIVTDELQVENLPERVENLCCGKDISFSGKIRYALEKVREEYVLFLLDDFFLKEVCDNTQLNKIVEYMQRNKVDYCRLIDIPKTLPKNKLYVEIPENLPYGVNLQMGIWKKNTLKRCLEGQELNPWELEVSLWKNGGYGKRVLSKAKKVCFHGKSYSICHGLIKGKYFYSAKKFLVKERLWNESKQKFDTISFSNELKYIILQKIKWNIPLTVRNAIKWVLSLFGKKFYS